MSTIKLGLTRMHEPRVLRLTLSHSANPRRSECLTAHLSLMADGKLLRLVSPTRLLIPCIAILVLGACRSGSNTPPNQQSRGQNNGALSSIKEADLLDQIEAFSTDVGELGEAAWQQLQAYPRQELVDRLVLMRDASNQDEFVKANIAFLLCNLDHDYEINREIIVSAFNQSPDTADLYEGQIDRLIQRGDKGLLQVLFAIAPRSDGALSDGLADTFAYQMTSSTEAFLTQLATQPRTTRSQVADFINSAISEEDKTAIKTFLKSIPASSPLAGLAKEMDSDLSKSPID